MIVLPVYDMMILPGVIFYFKKDVLSFMPVKEYKEDEDVLFLVRERISLWGQESNFRWFVLLNCEPRC